MPSRLPHLGIALAVALGAFIALTGVLKLVAPLGFYDQLNTWTLLPAWSHGVIAAIVPALEYALGLCIVLNLARRPALWGAVALVSLFTLAIAAQWAFAQAPTCGCFGVLSAYLSTLDDWRARIFFYTLLIAAGVVALVTTRSPSRADTTRDTVAALRRRVATR